MNFFNNVALIWSVYIITLIGVKSIKLRHATAGEHLIRI